MNLPSSSDRTPAPTPPPLLHPATSLFSRRADWWLWICMICLLGLGIVMVYSASVNLAYRKQLGPNYFLYKHLISVVLGFVAFFVAAHLDYRFYQRWAYPILLVAVVLLVAVLFFGHTANHAKRWFHVAGFSFQPAEFAKIALVIYLATILSQKGEQVRSFHLGFLPPLLVCGGVMLLLLKEPDLGTAMILFLVTLTMLFVSGTKSVYIAITVLVGAPVVYLSTMVNTSWRLRRLEAFFNPWKYHQREGLQSIKSMNSMGLGGLMGRGLGQGKIKLYLPEAHTDYILAVIGEELGFVGVGFVILLYTGLLVYGGWVARRARDAFGAYLALGITALISYQAVVNIAVVFKLIPTKGFTLPLVSFGGSSVVTAMFMLGVLLNISRGGPSNSLNIFFVELREWLLPQRQNRSLPGGGQKVVVEV